MDLLDELESRVLCGDGAIGTLLLEQGIPLDRCFEELCVKDPERVERIHQEYIGVGARVIETNTFGANAVRLERFGLEARVAEINRAAARLAVKAVQGKDVYVAGSVGPLGINGDEARARGIDRERCFLEQITALREGGVDVIFFETFVDFEEMKIAVEAWNKGGAGLALCSFACGPEGRIFSGELLPESFAELGDLGAKIVGANCMNDPAGMVHVLQRIPGEFLMAAYPSAGNPQHQEGRFIYHASPDYFAQMAGVLVAAGARLVGGCCGTTPQHIAALSGAIANLPPRPRVPKF